MNSTIKVLVIIILSGVALPMAACVGCTGLVTCAGIVKQSEKSP